MSSATVIDVSQDWETACDVQQRFMIFAVPTPQGVAYSARCRQLRALGGDCYGLIPLAQNRMAFTIGDASGKGLPAALMIANVQSSVRTAALFAGDEPEAVLGAVNRQLHTASLADRFATLFYGVYDPATHLLRYANAGHHRPLVIRQDGSVAWLDATGFPLGMFNGSNYDQAAFRLEPGDLLIAYTDGVVEAMNEHGEEWGAAGLISGAWANREKNAGELVDAVFALLERHAQGHLSDDATVAVLRVL